MATGFDLKLYYNQLNKDKIVLSIKLIKSVKQQASFSENRTSSECGRL